MLFFYIIVLFLMVCYTRKLLNQLRLDKRNLSSIILVQNNYIKTLVEQQAILDSKIKELAKLLPVFTRGDDHERAAVVMFQKFEDARNNIDKLEIDDSLKYKLKEILQ